MPFEPSSFDLNEACDSASDCFEAALVHEVTQRRLAFFGETEENDIRDTYKPITRKAGDYPRNLRVKLNTAGLYAVRFWDADKNRIDAPETLLGMTVNVCVTLRALWIGEDAWGIVVDCTDLQLAKSSIIQACPF